MNRLSTGIRLLPVFLLFIAGLAPAGADSLNVVATNAWTAAFCRLAGIEDVHLLAPANLQHPPDYELRPSDIPVVSNADIIVYAGYEGMMDRIRSNIAGSETELLQIKTVYSPMIIHESVMAIADAAGTSSLAARNLEAVDAAWKEAAAIVNEAGLDWGEAVVHFHQGAFAWAVGIFEVLSFGPAPPGAKTIGEAAITEASLIIDNWHNPVSAPIQEVLPEALVVELINFPGRNGTESLRDVILYNARTLAEAVE